MRNLDFKPKLGGGVNFYLSKNNKWFTLVELIIVVVIIAILATIAFLTLWDYPMQARDARRLSDKNNIEKALEIYRAEKWEYPKFDEENWQKVFWTWAWEKVNTSLSTLPRDPLTNKLYKIEIKETPDKVKIAKVVLDGESGFTNNKTQEKSNQLNTDPKAPDYIVPMENWKCKEWYLEYNLKCRKIWEMKLVYDLDKDWLNVKVHFSYSWVKFSSIDWWDNWQNNCPTSWDGYSNCTYAKKWVYTIRVKWYADNLRSLNNVENNWNKRIIEISDWNELWVKSLENAFYEAKIFNQEIWKFDVSNVKNMKNMFNGAEKFDQSLNNWNVSNVTNMEYMFWWAVNFNQPLNNWDVSNVTNMKYMFYWSEKFNQILNDWNVSKVTNMEGMFNWAKNFNQPLNNWNVSNVTNMKYMFYWSEKFNQILNDWNVSKVTNMEGMFNWAKNFNQPLNNWNVSNVTNMNHMFWWAKNFNQPLNNWNVSNVTNMGDMFRWTKEFNQPLDNWKVSNVTNMKSMFYWTEKFNQDLSSWDTSKVTNMKNMFIFSDKFNWNISSWNVSNVTNMESMFHWSKKFNQDISNWNVDKVTHFESFYENSALSSENVPVKFRK